MDDTKLKDVVGGSVDDATPQLAGLTREELDALHDIESKGKKRSTMLAAIDAAMKALGDAEKGSGDDATGKSDAASGSDATATSSAATGADAAASGGSGASEKTYTQAEVDQMLADQRDGQASMFTQAQLDEALAAQKLSLDAEKERAVAEAKGSKAETKTADQADVLTIGKNAPAPSLEALTYPTSVQFVDSEDRPIVGLPAMTFGPSDYEPNGDAVTLQTDVEFPKGIPATEVSGAFLLDDDGDPIGKARLVMPFAIGGGRTAKLGKSTLQFAR